MERDQEKSELNSSKMRKYRDALIVGGILVLIGSLNLYLLRQLYPVQSNYWQIPDSSSPYFNERVVLVGLERIYDEPNYPVVIYDLNNSYQYMNRLYYLYEDNGKYIHIFNCTSWDTWEFNQTYRFFFTYRSWWSEPFQVTPNGFEFI
jgi:hypothetical protein